MRAIEARVFEWNFSYGQLSCQPLHTIPPLLPVTACKQILCHIRPLSEASYIFRALHVYGSGALGHFPSGGPHSSRAGNGGWVFPDRKHWVGSGNSAQPGDPSDKDRRGWRSGGMLEFGRPPSHAVSSLTLISGTTLECRVIPTIRAGERRLLLRQGRSYLYDPGTCKCLRKFSGIGRAGNYFIGQIVARSLRRVYFPFLPSPLLLFPFFSFFLPRVGYELESSFFLDFYARATKVKAHEEK